MYNDHISDITDDNFSVSPGQAGIGGPLLDFDGKFVGMNFYDKHAGGTWYLTWEEILHVLGHFEKKKVCLGIQVLVMRCIQVSITYRSCASNRTIY